jgi:hypothetical protein
MQGLQTYQQRPTGRKMRKFFSGVGQISTVGSREKWVKFRLLLTNYWGDIF